MSAIHYHLERTKHLRYFLARRLECVIDAALCHVALSAMLSLCPGKKMLLRVKCMPWPKEHLTESALDRYPWWYWRDMTWFCSLHSDSYQPAQSTASAAAITKSPPPPPPSSATAWKPQHVPKLGMSRWIKYLAFMRTSSINSMDLILLYVRWYYPVDRPIY